MQVEAYDEVMEVDSAVAHGLTDDHRTYQKDPRIGPGMAGNDYQCAVVVALLLYAHKSKKDFQIETEVAGVGAFDDVVLTMYDNKPSGPCTRYYIQVKHHKKKSYQPATLTTKTDDGISIPKMFESWEKAHEDNSVQHKYMIVSTADLSSTISKYLGMRSDTFVEAKEVFGVFKVPRKLPSLKTLRQEVGEGKKATGLDTLETRKS